MNPGEVLAGRYELVRLLGLGGMGAVYEAIQLPLRRKVAVKVMHASKAAEVDLARFVREANTLAGLVHPHIVQILDFQAEPGQSAFIVMEYLEGETLKARLQRTGKIPEREVVELVLQVLSALSETHSRGVVHRDIKLENLLLVQSEALGAIVKVLDFGIAKVDGDPVPLTRAGDMVGTLAYMSPEQVMGQAVDFRSDIYSLGVCMYYACSGSKPFSQETGPSMLQAILAGESRPLSLVHPMVDAEFSAIVHRAFAHQKADRFGSAAEMAQVLRGWLERAPALKGGSRGTALMMASEPPTAATSRDAIPSSFPHGAHSTAHARPSAPPQSRTDSLPPRPYSNPPALWNAPALSPPQGVQHWQPPPPERQRGSSKGVWIALLAVAGLIMLAGTAAAGIAFFALKSDSPALLPGAGADGGTAPAETATAKPLSPLGTPSAVPRGGKLSTPSATGRSSALVTPTSVPTAAPTTPAVTPTVTPTSPPTITPPSGKETPPSSRLFARKCQSSADCKMYGAEGVCDMETLFCRCGGLSKRCGDRCIDPMADPDHCGACGNACAPADRCSFGECKTCASGQMASCGGHKCVHTNTDQKNCGACGNACAADQGCEVGRCIPIAEWRKLHGF